MAKVYFMFGQSNMRGQDAISNALENLQDKLKGVYIWDNNAGAFASIEAGVNNGGTAQSQDSTIGLEMEFARLVRQYNTNENVYLIKYGINSKHLENADLSNSFYPRNGQHYINMLSFLDGAMAALPGETLDGILMHQGEADAVTGSYYDNYEENLTLIINLLRAYVALKNYGSSTVRFGVGKIKFSTTFTGATTVQAAQAAVTSALDNCFLATTDNFPLIDTVHFSADSQASLAQKFYYGLLGSATSY